MTALPSKKLFGTDGVRGVAGELLTAELALALGRAGTEGSAAARPQVLIVRDTRESGPMLAAALAAGVAAAGGDALDARVLPTPAASVLVRRLGLDLAAVISASHNPWHDNGIKFFGPDGRKLDDRADAGIEARVAELLAGGGPRRVALDMREKPVEPGRSVRGLGRVRALEGALDDYLRELAAAFRIDLSGVRVALDCANGSTYRAAPAIFERLGAEVDAIAIEPDGRNINDGCGSTDPASLAERVRSSGAALGFAFDGDGDRVVAVDSTGAVRDGDELIALVATHLGVAGRLDGGVAVTVMSNYGFHRAMADAGIEVATTPVGDRSVSAELERREWTLGGEQSGHLIWTGFAPTGDGIAAALLALQALAGADLAATRPIERLPQVLTNVTVAERDAVDGAGAVWDAVEREAAALEGRGRVLVRASGTEPLVRVMVEAPSATEAEEACGRLVEIVRAELGHAG
ncbi:MAG: phosphoglucosamine mutase [Solirubrobacterales bacterium]|nr:phosphoglucosamine mutase [Solirubrobacterales bacterium]